MTESDSVLEIDAAGRERRPDFWGGLWGISQFGTFENLSKGCSSQGGAVEGCGKRAASVENRGSLIREFVAD